MPLVLADRVKETTTTTGTGTLTLAGAATGFQSFSVIGNGNTTYYAIATSSGSEWEVGIGTYTSSGTTLARTTILASSNSGSAVNLSAGTKDVFVTLPSSKATATATTVSDTANSSTGYFQIPQGTTAQRPGSPTNGMMRINTTDSTFEIYSTVSNDWKAVATFTSAVSSVEYLVVAGGGSGGSRIGGGGGAGGYRTATGFSVTTGVSYTVTVGAGGAAVTSTPGVTGNNGNDSVFSTITSTAGGGGGAYINTSGTAGKNGGSGGGGSFSGNGGVATAGTGTSGQGSSGGVGSNSQTNGGGGGGASAAGAAATGAGGVGGAGSASSISGSSVTYAGGGGGSGDSTAGAGGSGGGGAGATGTSTGTSGTANTGGGGGGARNNSDTGGVSSGAGGSGIVIIRYADSAPAAASTTGSPTITVAGGYRVYKWTGSGTITF